MPSKKQLSASAPILEGREREFRRALARFLFDELLGWEKHSKIGEIYDITCFDDENFPTIVIETKWGVKPTREIKEKLRRRIMSQSQPDSISVHPIYSPLGFQHLLTFGTK